MVVAGQRSLSDAQIGGIISWAKGGGKPVLTGDSGRYDEFNAQRLVNPMLSQLKGLPNVVCRESADVVSPAKIGWSNDIGAPKDHGDRLLADLAATGWRSPFSFLGLPETVAVDVRHIGRSGFVFHFVNYDPAHVAKGSSVVWTDGRHRKVPDLEEYALLEE